MRRFDDRDDDDDSDSFLPRKFAYRLKKILKKKLLKEFKKYEQPCENCHQPNTKKK